jgi:outer membrane protein
MRKADSMLARFVSCLALLLAVANGWSQVKVQEAARGGWLRPYSPRFVPEVNFKNSERIYTLVRAGQIYLSLNDALALALENNLDIELQRYSPAIAETDVTRASGGGTLRGVPLSVRELPAGVGGPGAPLLTAVGAATPSGSISPNIGELGGIAQQETSLSVLGTNSTSAGPPLPVFEPTLSGRLDWSHQSNLQSTLSSYGVNPVMLESLSGTFGVQKGFATGTSVSAGYTSQRQSANWIKPDYNPFTMATAGVTVTQRLLQGFRLAVNQRYIRIARNNRQVSENVFHQQVIATAASVIRLYWDLVSLYEDVRVKRDALRVAETLRENNRAQVEAGTLAPIEVKRAQAEVARGRQDLTNAESLLIQQELVLKKVLTRSGMTDERLRGLRLVPLDRIEIPPRDDVRPIEELVGEAYRNRPDLTQARLQISNSEISLRASKNALLPSLDLVAGLQNNALAGQSNLLGVPSGADPFYLGGAGTLLSQLFARNFPNYSVGFQLNVPLRNRVAQADVVRDQLEIRQSQVRLHNIEQQVRLEIESALIALTRARTAFQAAVETRQLQQEALDAERDRYAVGASTSFFVIQSQRDLAQARTTEVIARGNYAKARAALDRATGATLEKNKIQMSDALRGEVSKRD